MTSEDWIQPITFHEEKDIHLGDGMLHDGYVDVHLGATLSKTGEKLLNELLRLKRPAVDSVVRVNYDKTLRVVAKPKRGGIKSTKSELQKMAEDAVVTINAWAKKLSLGDIAICTGHQLTDEQIKAAMATSSDSHADYTD